MYYFEPLKQTGPMPLGTTVALNSAMTGYIHWTPTIYYTAAELPKNYHNFPSFFFFTLNYY